MPTEKYDHRYGLRDYAMTYTGLYIMENSIRVPGNQSSREAQDEQHDRVRADAA